MVAQPVWKVAMVEQGTRQAAAGSSATRSSWTGRLHGTLGSRVQDPTRPAPAAPMAAACAQASTQLPGASVRSAQQVAVPLSGPVGASAPPAQAACRAPRARQASECPHHPTTDPSFTTCSRAQHSAARRSTAGPSFLHLASTAATSAYQRSSKAVGTPGALQQPAAGCSGRWQLLGRQACKPRAGWVACRRGAAQGQRYDREKGCCSRTNWVQHKGHAAASARLGPMIGLVLL